MLEAQKAKELKVAAFFSVICLKIINKFLEKLNENLIKKIKIKIN